MSDLIHKSATSATKSLQSKLTVRVVSVLAGALFGSFFTYFGVREPNAMYDPQGGASLFCDVREIANVESSMGMVLTANNTTCTVFGTSSITYVYLTPKGRTPSRVNLVMRYDGEDPDLSWIGSQQALVRIRSASDIDKQVVKLLGVTIVYSSK